MRITYTCPPHVTFRLHIKDWNDMLKCSTESMEWLHAKDDALDTIFIYAYTATSCALVQYHTWARRRTRHALDMLKLVKETANKWEAAVKPGESVTIFDISLGSMLMRLRPNVDTAQDVRDHDSALRSRTQDESRG